MAFPDDIIECIKAHMEDIPGVVTVVKRVLRAEDENGTAGIVATTRRPDEVEMGMSFGGEPTLSTWEIVIGHFVKNADEQEAERTHIEVADSLWRMLYQDQAFVVDLRSLVDLSGVMTQRVQRHWVVAQRFAHNEIEGKFVRMSATELNVQIQTG